MPCTCSSLLVSPLIIMLASIKLRLSQYTIHHGPSRGGGGGGRGQSLFQEGDMPPLPSPPPKKKNPGDGSNEKH